MEKINEKSIGRLIGDINRLQGTQADKLMDSLGLFRAQGFILMVVSDNEGITHSELANELRISPAAASKVIKRLEEKGLLIRKPDPADERISRVFLLEDGRSVIDQIRQYFREIESVMLSDLSTQEKETLMNLLLKIYSNLQNVSSRQPE